MSFLEKCKEEYEKWAKESERSREERARELEKEILEEFNHRFGHLLGQEKPVTVKRTESACFFTIEGLALVGRIKRSAICFYPVVTCEKCGRGLEWYWAIRTPIDLGEYLLADKGSIICDSCRTVERAHCEERRITLFLESLADLLRPYLEE